MTGSFFVFDATILLEVNEVLFSLVRSFDAW